MPVTLSKRRKAKGESTEKEEKGKKAKAQHLTTQAAAWYVYVA